MGKGLCGWRSQLAVQWDIASIDRGDSVQWGMFPVSPSERLVVWCAWSQPECQLSWMCSQSCRGTAGKALKGRMQAVVHEASLLLAESHLVHAGNQLEETQCASLGFPPVRKYFSVSFIMMYKELVVTACSRKAPLKC